MSSLERSTLSTSRQASRVAILDDLPRDFFHEGLAPPGIHNYSLRALRKNLCFNDHRKNMWSGLIAFLSLPALTRKFSFAYLGGGFISLKEYPADIDVVLETIEEYGPEAFSSISRFFLVGLKRIEQLYGVHLHFWMKNAPPGVSDFRAFFQYEKIENKRCDLSPTRGILQIDLQASDILETIREQLVSSQDTPLPLDEILPDIDPRTKGLERLADTVNALSCARTLDSITEIVRKEARRLLRADGATFVLKEGTNCHYIDEDTISPLWKGQRFAMASCISGWVMMNRQAVAIPDIQKDNRIPLAVYKSTFVKSLLMTPIRTNAPIGAIGIYWSQIHEATPFELELAQHLADATAVAMENIELRGQLKLQLRDSRSRLQDTEHQIRLCVSNVDRFKRLLRS